MFLVRIPESHTECRLNVSLMSRQGKLILTFAFGLRTGTWLRVSFAYRRDDSCMLLTSVSTLVPTTEMERLVQVSHEMD